MYKLIKMKNINSYGILAYNENSVLLIRKRITYAFIEFTNGRYNMENIHLLFNNMTSQEKLIILTFNFKFIWYHCNLNMQNNKFYKKAKIKFDLLQRSAYVKKIKGLISESNDVELLWEIPKGRQRKCENNINTAVREFYEETSIKNDNYHILFNVNPIIHPFVDDGVNYTYYYYPALILNKNYKPSLNYYSNNMIFEISDIKFIPINNLHNYISSNELIKKIKLTYNFIKKIDI